MALTWDLTRIENSDEVCWVEALQDDPAHFIEKGKSYMNPVTNVLIWATISVDLPGITEENVGEFYARLHLTEQTIGPMLIRAEVDGVRPEGEKAMVTMDEVIAHIGLRCNVSPLTRAKWLKRISRDMDETVAKVTRKLAERTDDLLV